MKKYTIAEYAREKSVTEHSVRYKVERGKLLTRKEMINNRETTIIMADESEEFLLPAEQVTERNKSQCQQITEHITEKNGTPIKSDVNNNGEVLTVFKQMYDDNLKLIDKIQLLSELAGQAKLLTDSENRTKQEYFQIIQENATLKATLDLKNQQLEELKQKLENQSFNNWFRKL